MFGVSTRVQAEYAYQIQNSFQYNDHLEFGLSVAPNTNPLAGRQDYQLSGLINQSQVKGKLSDSITSRLVGEVRGNAQHHQYFERRY